MRNARKDTPGGYQVKVTLLGARPPIWRRLLLRGDTKLDRLHLILQLVMGWTDSHMHQFQVAERSRASPGQLRAIERGDEKRIRLSAVMSNAYPRMLYEYDFGDSWEHGLELEKIVPLVSDGKYPWVLAGKRAGPPEDVGGLPGFAHFLAVMASPRHPEHKELREWYSGSYDSEAFDVAALNRAFHGGWGPAPKE
jgi:hypothetical protein